MAVPAAAAGTPTLSISSGEVKAGESVTLTVSIEDNPGIATALVYVYFDSDVFSLDPDNDVKMQGSFGNNGLVVSNTIDNMKGTATYDGDAGKDGVAVLWVDLSGQNISADGNFLNIKLKADKQAPNGEYTIGLGVSRDNTCDAESSLVSMNASSGTLTVSGGSGEMKEESTSEPVEFTDISGHWAESYIRQSSEIGLVEGYQGLYRPDDTMTRAEFVTILWRAMGEPEPSGKASFTDLTQDWYFKSVAWAEENNVVNGMGGGLFMPNGAVTREQLVTILHRLAGNPMGMDLMLSGIYDSQYPDSKDIGEWARQAMYWSIYEGIYCGENSEDIGAVLAPKANANRAQIAVMMIRYLNNQ